MSAVDLWRELIAARADHHVDEILGRYGVTDPDAQAHCGLVQIEHPDIGRFYEPRPGGEYAIIVPVMDGEELVDLLAFDPRKPDRWWVRLDACCFLGGDNIFCQSAPIEIWRTPLRWLKATCEGVVVLDWGAASPTLRPLEEAHAEDTDHGQDIRRRLQQPLPIPEIRVPECTVKRAA